MLGLTYSMTKLLDYEQIAQKGNNCSPEEQLAEGMTINQNTKRPSHKFLP